MCHDSSKRFAGAKPPLHMRSLAEIRDVAFKTDRELLSTVRWTGTRPPETVALRIGGLEAPGLSLLRLPSSFPGYTISSKRTMRPVSADFSAA